MAAVAAFRRSGDISILPSTDENSIPTLASVSSEYASLTARRAALLSEAARLHRDMVARADAHAERRPQVLQAGAGETDRALRLAALVSGEPATVPARPPADPLVRIQEITAAVEVLDRKINAARMAASATICAEIVPRYREIAGTVVDRLLALREAQLEYRAFAAALNDREIAWSVLGALALDDMLGDPAHRHGPVGRMLRDAIAHDLIPESRVPEALR